MDKSIRIFSVAAFAAGLATIGWIGIGYVGVSPLALVMTALIALAYIAGGVELLRFQQATNALAHTLGNVQTGLSSLGEWLQRVPPSLQNPVRMRVEGERVALPGPTLTPYLVGLLVLLGMLGTFLGMVVTFKGAVFALEGTSDLQAIRSALAAPVKGLGVAFGTSVAGVAASAMLGLVSALCRRERLRVAQLLDTRIATALRGFSLVHQRQEAFAALQAQAQTLPGVVDKLQAMMAQMERHSLELHQRLAGESRDLNERLAGEQERFHSDAKNSYAGLAASISTSMQELKAQLAGEQARFYGDATESYSALATAVGTSVQELRAQLVGDQARFYSAATDGYSELAGAVAASVNELKQQLADGQERFHGDARANYATLAANVGESLKASIAESVRVVGATIEPQVAATLHGLAQETTALQQRAAAAVSQQLDGIAARFDTSVSTITETWTAALATHEQTSGTIASQLQASLQSVADSFDRRATATVAAMQEQGVALQSELAAADQARQAALAQTIETLGTALQQEWREVGARTLAQQEQLCAALGESTREIVGEAQAQASSTIAEVACLMETAAQAPRVAAEVIGELRNELSTSMARDNELLAERVRIMETLNTLLASIEQMSTAQREAIDGLVTASATMLERASGQFEQRIDAESGRLEEAGGQLTASAIEVASLSDAFGVGVQRFADANNELMTTLARIEGALDKSATRSDEQLAYYVAQAREIIDLSLMSQRRIIDELQQRAGEPAPATSEA